MLFRNLIGATALLATLAVMPSAQAFDESKYPDFKGQWHPIGGPGRYDISKPAGRGQQAPLTAEYQGLF